MFGLREHDEKQLINFVHDGYLMTNGNYIALYFVSGSRGLVNTISV